MQLHIKISFIFVVFLLGFARAQEIVWHSPSKDALDSMPLSGSEGAGANVWVQDNSIWLYLAHNGAYDENGKLLKLGCIRITPENFQPGEGNFVQTLDPQSGTITIKQGKFSASLWFSGETLLLESSNETSHKLTISYGIWRDNQEFNSNEDGFLWFHKNTNYPVDLIGQAAKQGISKDALYDVTTNRVFGAAMAVTGGLSKPVASEIAWQLWKGKGYTGMTTNNKQHTIAITLGAKLNGDPKKWQQEAKALVNEDNRKKARASELKRWKAFWGRSHIFINADAKPDDPGYLVGQNYQLFRYMLACNRNGEFPLLFNGGIFTTDVGYGRINGMTYSFKKREGQELPDYRRWGQTFFMSQNERWMGWPTLAGGDLDMLEPTMAFYRNRAKTANARAINNGADGVVYPEPLDVWGLCTIKPLANGFCGSKHLTYHFSIMIEIAYMCLQAHNSLGRDISRDLEWVKGTVLFYDSFYRNECKKRTGKELDENGKLLIYPSNALELLSGATNPVEVVCGLKRVTEGLLSLPGLSDKDRKEFLAIQKRLPEIPVGKRNGVNVVLEAKSYEEVHNKWEPLEMFSFWPYRYFGVTQPQTLQLARDTWDNIPKDRIRCIDEDYSWMANVANVASLQRPEESRKRVVYKLANNTKPQARFPAFFGPGHDWIPDHNWGGSGMTGLQEMVMACQPKSDGKIYLFPSWPSDWDVDFKLYAPGQTQVECVYKNGKIMKLTVTPESRKKDVVILLKQ